MGPVRKPKDKAPWLVIQGSGEYDVEHSIVVAIDMCPYEIGPTSDQVKGRRVTTLCQFSDNYPIKLSE